MQMKVEKRFAAARRYLPLHRRQTHRQHQLEINWLEASPVGWNDANVYNLRGERSLDAFDVSQHLYSLPFLTCLSQGQEFANNLNGVANKLISGWGIDTIITFQRGFPIIIGGCPGLLSDSGARTWAVPAIPGTALSKQTSGSLDQRGPLV